MTIKIIKKNKDAVIPEYQTSKSACFDIHALLEETITIKHGEIKLIPTGLGVQSFYEDIQVLKLYIRSSLGMKGVSLANQVGIIDEDYDGEIMVMLKNESSYDFIVKNGDRISQGLIENVVRCNGIVVKEKVRNGGFGSTEG